MDLLAITRIDLPARNARLLLAATLLFIGLNPTSSLADELDADAGAESPSDPWAKIVEAADWKSLTALLDAVFHDCSLPPGDVSLAWHPREVKACKRTQKEVIRKLPKQTIVVPTAGRIVKLDERKHTVAIALGGAFCAEVQRLDFELHDPTIGESYFQRFVLTKKTRDWYFHGGMDSGEGDDCVWMPTEMVAATVTISVTADEFASLAEAKATEESLRDEIYGTDESRLQAWVALRLGKPVTIKAKKTTEGRKPTIRGVLAKPVAWRVAIGERMAFGRLR